VPFASLPDDYWQFDEREQTLTGRRTQKVYRLAQEVEVLLSEANPVTGGMVFHVLEGAMPDHRLSPSGDQSVGKDLAGKRPPGKRAASKGFPGKDPPGKRPPRR
jgi:ribonuclease R